LQNIHAFQYYLGLITYHAGINLKSMTLQQLRYFCEIAAQGWNISQAAKAIYTSQPGMSRQMYALERELGVTVFARRRNRIVGLTEPGRAALAMAKLIVGEAVKLKQLRSQFSDEEGGSLTIAATHTQARYVLPKVLKHFTRAHPRVELVLKQGIPGELARLVGAGEADLSVSTIPPKLPEDVVMLPCLTPDRIAVVPAGHPLAKKQRLTLKHIAKFPIITYDAAFVGRSMVLGAFERAGLTPKVAISAVDTDVMKAYVAEGLGVAIMSELAFDARADRKLRAVRVTHLFGRDPIYLGLRRYTYLRRYVLDFIRLYSPKLTASAVAEAVGLRL
jgi:LysR family cys regulon transcriptional activator